MKRRHLMISGIGLPVLLLLTVAMGMQQQARQPSTGGAGEEPGGPKRKVVDISDHTIPVRVSAVRNVDSVDWLKDMEVEIENKSNRPIYYVRIVLMFPDVPETTELDGIPRGLSATLRYGRMDFALHPGEIAKPEDLPIRPGEKALLKLEPEKCESLRRYLSRHSVRDSMIKQLRFRIRDISFGDGSGYRSGSTPYS